MNTSGISNFDEAVEANMHAASPFESQDGREVTKETGIRQKIGFLCMLVGLFLAILDTQIVVASLKDIQAGLSASADEISWVQASYLIGEIIMIPLSAFLSRLLSTRVLFTLSAAGFTVMSLACALASTMGEMVAYRALQGFMGGAMIPTVFATGFILFPPSKQAGVTVIIGLISTLAPTVGPVLGGYVTEALSWRWLFLINVVPGAIIAIGVWFLIDVDRSDWSLIAGFDYVGLIFLAICLGSLEYVLHQGPRHGWLGDMNVCWYAVAGTLSAVLFFWRALTYHRPVLELRTFANCNFTVGCLFSFVLGIGLYGGDYLTTLYLAQSRGLNSLQIGEVMFVTGLFELVGAPVAWWLSRMIDPRLMLASGYLLYGSGTYIMMGMTPEWEFQELLLPQALRGFSLMLCFVPATTLAFGTLAMEHLQNASGLYNLMRNLGGTIGLAALDTMLNERLALHWRRLADSINAADPMVQERLETWAETFEGMIAGDPAAAALNVFAGFVQRQAIVMSFNDCFMVVTGLFLVILLLIPLIRRPSWATGSSIH